MSSKSNKPVLAAAGIAGSLLLAGTAFAATPLAQGYMLGAAQDHADHVSHGIENMDTDKDGRLSPAEFAAAHGGDDSRFAEYDADSDGFISAAEMDARHAAMKDGKDDKAGMEGKCGEGKCGGM
ncbi:hypothetical protein N799_03585 [Lysobacter arseniciresistens ZS79]|uniref:EF-hand domain-containing protein n=1 Tax=Lysobacter arseniciresistens ZS79 TaxID=913325 RepID=A0A0A0F2E6_9GAMM|nr:hypothetical protein [Lysobacter arseniciresistens]KGM56508.1 hypothetical protein N799_03585 [Lysobacter arseniciresistens ZS79]